MPQFLLHLTRAVFLYLRASFGHLRTHRPTTHAVHARCARTHARRHACTPAESAEVLTPSPHSALTHGGWPGAGLGTPQGGCCASAGVPSGLNFRNSRSGLPSLPSLELRFPACISFTCQKN